MTDRRRVRETEKGDGGQGKRRRRRSRDVMRRRQKQRDKGQEEGGGGRTTDRTREGTKDERREVELLMESVVCGLHISFVGDGDT